MLVIQCCKHRDRRIAEACQWEELASWASSRSQWETLSQTYKVKNWRDGSTVRSRGSLAASSDSVPSTHLVAVYKSKRIQCPLLASTSTANMWYTGIHRGETKQSKNKKANKQKTHIKLKIILSLKRWATPRNTALTHSNTHLEGESIFSPLQSWATEHSRSDL